MNPTWVPRLRSSMVALGGVLLVVALVTSFALILLTTVLRQETMRMGVADARIRASLRTKVALLWYARASDVEASEPSASARDEQMRAESDIRSALTETRRLAEPQRVAQLDSLLHKSEAYVELRDRLATGRLSIGAMALRATPSLEAAFVDLDQIIAADDAWERSVEGSAHRWDSIANVMGVSAAALLLAGFTVAIVGTSLFVERPIRVLTEAMTRFEGGDETYRSVPHGTRELRHMATTFNELADRLVQRKQERLTFLAGVAHDLRNPISALKLTTDALKRGPQPPPPKTATKTLVTVAQQVDRLDRMVGDLLDAARIESGRFELRRERTDLRAIVSHVAELFSPVSGTREIEVIAPEEPAWVECDPTRLEQVVTNLVSNAIKYSPEGGRVTTAVTTSGSDAVVAVTDEGIGIPADDLARLFEPFYRGSASRERVPGVGLGLSVARKLVEAHGGRLDVESQVGRGTTFRVLLHASPGARADDGSS